MAGKRILSLCFLCLVLAGAARTSSGVSPSMPGPDGGTIDCSGNVVNNSKARVQDHDPALAWNGKNFGIVWVTDGSRLMFAVLGADGKRVSGPRLLYDAHGSGSGYAVEYPDIVWTGGSYLIVYSDSYKGRTYFSLQVSAAGAVMKGPINLKTEPSWTYEWAGALAWNGSQAGFVYVNQDKNLYFKILSKTGGAVGKPALVASNAGRGRFKDFRTDIAWNGKEFGVAWITQNGSAVNYQAVSAKGALVGSRASCAKTSGEFEFLSMTPGKKGSYSFGLAFTEYIMNVRTVVYFTQIARTGKLLHKVVNVRNVPLESRYVGNWPYVAWNPAKGVFYVSWQDNRVGPETDPGITSYYNFFLRTIKTNGTFGSEETLLNIKFKEKGYYNYECAAAFSGAKLCIGFIRSLSQNNTDPNQRHYRAYSVSVRAL